jgi:hypothetical protein
VPVEIIVILYKEEEKGKWSQLSLHSANQSAQGAHGHGLSISRKGDRQNRYQAKMKESEHLTLPIIKSGRPI